MRLFTNEYKGYKKNAKSTISPAEKPKTLASEPSLVAGTVVGSLLVGASGTGIIGSPQIADHDSSLLSSSTQIAPYMSLK